MPFAHSSQIKPYCPFGFTLPHTSQRLGKKISNILPNFSKNTSLICAISMPIFIYTHFFKAWKLKNLRFLKIFFLYVQLFAKKLKDFEKKVLTVSRWSGVIGGLFTNEWRKSFGNEKKKVFWKKVKKQLDKENGIVLNGRPFHEEPKFLLRSGWIGKVERFEKTFKKNKKFSWQRLKDSSWWMAFHEKVGEEKKKFFEIY